MAGRLGRHGADRAGGQGLMQGWGRLVPTFFQHHRGHFQWVAGGWLP